MRVVVAHLGRLLPALVALVVAALANQPARATRGQPIWAAGAVALTRLPLARVALVSS